MCVQYTHTYAQRKPQPTKTRQAFCARRIAATRTHTLKCVSSSQWALVLRGGGVRSVRAFLGLCRPRRAYFRAHTHAGRSVAGGGGHKSCGHTLTRAYKGHICGAAMRIAERRRRRSQCGQLVRARDIMRMAECGGGHTAAKPALGLYANVCVSVCVRVRWPRI